MSELILPRQAQRNPLEVEYDIECLRSSAGLRNPCAAIMATLDLKASITDIRRSPNETLRTTHPLTAREVVTRIAHLGP